EAGHLVGPQVRRHDAAVRRVVGNLAADVPELLEVEVLGVLGGLHPERGVAARAAAAGHVVLLLGLFRQREEGLERVVGLVDQLLRDAVVADPGEAPLAVGGAEVGHEGLAVGGAVGLDEAADVEGRDARGHGSLGLDVSRGGRWPAMIPPRRGRGLDPAQPARPAAQAAACTAAARRSSVAATRASSSASTVTRTTGSVPEGRRKARPRPCTARWASASARCTLSASAGRAPLATRTLTVRCGTLRSPASASARPIPRRCSTSSTCNALTMPSPVVARSRHSRWPEASPPRMPPCSTRAWCT